MATATFDDGFFTVDLPFPIAMLGESSSTINIGVNGWISTSDGTRNYWNGPLPHFNLPDTSFIPYWSDLLISPGKPQGLYYSVYGESGSRRVAFEWKTGVSRDETGYHHFLATFQEEAPSRVTFDYYGITARSGSSNDGLLGTVGVQRRSGPSGELFAQYSFNNNPPITEGLRVVFDPASNSFTSSRRTSCDV